MIPIINKHRADLAEICRRYGVNRLYIFGSAAQDRFDPDRSDLDFLVKIAGREPSGSYADRYLDLADALERLFGRRWIWSPNNRSGIRIFGGRSKLLGN